MSDAGYRRSGMEKKIALVFLLAVSLFCPLTIFSEIIVLKSGRIVNGDIIYAEESYVTVLEGSKMEQHFKIEDIDTIDSVDAKAVITDIARGLQAEIADIRISFGDYADKAGMKDRDKGYFHYLKSSILSISLLPIALFIFLGLFLLLRMSFFQ